MDRGSHAIARAVQAALALAGAATGAMLGAATHGALAGDTIGLGTCHGHTVGTASTVTCRGNYTIRDPNPGVPGSALNIRDIRDYAPLLEQPAEQAETNWNAAPGPQSFSSAPQFNDGWNYLHARIDPLGLLAPGVWGITYLCNSVYNPDPNPTGGGGVAAGPCFAYARPIDVQWADIYFNFVDLAQQPTPKVVTAVAHELGHSVGLAHHRDTGSLMYPKGSDIPFTGPTSEDLGSLIDCRGAAVDTSQWVVRCIYGWYETSTALPTTPTRTAVPTATNTPVGGGGCPNGKC